MQKKSIQALVRHVLCASTALFTAISVGGLDASAKSKVVTTTTTTTSIVHSHPVSTRKRKVTRISHSKNASRNFMINTIQQAARTK